MLANQYENRLPVKTFHSLNNVASWTGYKPPLVGFLNFPARPRSATFPTPPAMMVKLIEKVRRELGYCERLKDKHESVGQKFKGKKYLGVQTQKIMVALIDVAWDVLCRAAGGVAG